MNNILFAATRKTTGAALALSLGLILSGCGGMANNRSLDSVHQPVVERVNYVLDVSTGSGGLSYSEQRRLDGWFEAMDLRYGDRIFIDDPIASPATRAAVATAASRYGLIVNDGAPVTSGHLAAGTTRIVIARSRATVPGCPDWSAKSDVNLRNATSSNYGCATNSNLASMVADPEHLIKGAEGTGNTVVMSSTKAISTFREKVPTGAQELSQTGSMED